MLPLPGGHLLLGAGDEGAGPRLPHPVLHLHCVQYHPHQRRPFRIAGRSHLLPQSLWSQRTDRSRKPVRLPALSVLVPVPRVPPASVSHPAAAAGAVPAGERPYLKSTFLQRIIRYDAATEGPAEEEEAQGPGRNDSKFRWVLLYRHATIRREKNVNDR